MAEGRRWRDRNLLLPAVVAAVGTARLCFLCCLPDRLLARYIPDDAFYYLVMGRNFAATGRWTFDGVDPGSGFHLLWGYLLALIYWVRPAINLQGVVAVGGLISLGCVTLAAWLAGRVARRLFGEVGTDVGVGLIVLSALALSVDMALMETPLVLLASAAVLDWLGRDEQVATSGLLAAGIGLGVAGMLARSDFGLLPACLFAMQLVMWGLGKSSSTKVRLAGSVLVGSVVGLGLVMLHTHWISGEWVQGSVQQKLAWSRAQGFSSEPFRRLLFRIFLVAENSGAQSRRVLWPATLAAWGLLVALGSGLLLTLRRRVQARVVVAGLCLTILAYAVFYRFNSADMQSWYVANVEIPLAVLAGGGASWFVRRYRGMTLAVAGVVCLVGVLLSFKQPIAYQAQMYDAALYLRTHRELKPVGSWNAGIAGYFGGGGVTNLDGLVNDRVLPYAATGSIADYVRLRRLHTLMDFEMWLSPGLAVRAGDSRGELRRCFEEQAPLDGDRNSDNFVRVFKLRPECTAVEEAPSDQLK